MTQPGKTSTVSYSQKLSILQAPSDVLFLVMRCQPAITVKANALSTDQESQLDTLYI